MAQPLLRVRGLSKAYGSQRVLNEADLTLHPGDKAAIVGPNGSGKTTLFKILMGHEIPDMGEIHLRDGARVAYLPQVPDVPDGTLVEAVLAKPSARATKLQREIRELEAWMQRADAWDQPDANQKMAHYSELQGQLAEETSKSKAIESPVLSDLGVAPEMLDAKFGDLSGGEKSKILLASALGNARETDLLILDEPTNHMDIPTVEWIEEYLLELDAALLLSSHDKYLLDNIATKVLEVAGTKIASYPGNYSAYQEQKEALIKAYEARRKRHHAELKRQNQIIQELRRRNQYDGDLSARRRMVDRMKREGAGQGPAAGASRGFRLMFNAAQKSGRDLMRIEGLAKSYGDRVLFKDLDWEIEKGDKVGIVGLNGTGKTTLLRLLTEAEEPDAGLIIKSPGTRVGYYDQNQETLDHGRTLYHEIRSVRDPPPDEGWCRGLLGRFGFSGDTVKHNVGDLSGGERARLAIAKFVAHQHNLLVLDEPTNHLDMASQEIVAQALEAYEGSVVVVSHDRSFLDRFVNKVAVINDHQVGVFVGSFREAWTAAKVGSFLGGADGSYRVVRKFKDWEARRDYVVGDTIALTGAETQGFRRLLRWAEATGRVERT